MKQYQHLAIHIDEYHCLWIRLDVQNQLKNQLSSLLIDELMSAFAHITQYKHLKLIVLSSAKPHNFLVSYDLEQLQSLRHRQAALKLARQSQELAALLQSFPIPIIAVINGECSGVGVELALACDNIIALNNSTTQFAHHDLDLGIPPCLGNFSSLISRMGAKEAWEWLLSGQVLDAHSAHAKGLVDHLVDSKELDLTLQTLICYTKSDLKNRQQRLGSWSNAFKWTTGIIIKKLIHPTYPAQYYPAPWRLLENWQQFSSDTPQKRSIEAQTFSDLVLSNPSTHLVYLKQAEQKLLNTLPPPLTFRPNIAIFGTNPLGIALAISLLQEGFTVAVRETNPQQRLHAELQIKQTLMKQHPLEHSTILQRLLWIKNAEPIQAEVAIEAMPDKLSVKQEILAELEEITPASTLLISTSLCHSLSHLVSPMLQPQRVVGLHIFMPFNQGSLVELVHLPTLTDSNMLERTAALLRLINRLPLVLTNEHSFVTYRILVAYLIQGMRLQQQGVPAPTIDEAACHFGMQYGPLELSDYIGLDVCLQLSEIAKLHSELEIPSSLRTLVTNGKLGRKTQSGFYRYRDERTLKIEHDPWTGNAEQMQRKIIKPMIEEARICLELGIIEEASLLDWCVVKGCGFPRFRGGPIRHTTHPLI